MTRTTIAIVLALSLGACAKGTPEFAALPDTGPLTPTRLSMATAVCKMRASDKISEAVDHDRFPDFDGVVGDVKNCYMAQGVQLTGWRQADGRLTTTPFTN